MLDYFFPNRSKAVKKTEPDPRNSSSITGKSNNTVKIVLEGHPDSLKGDIYIGLGNKTTPDGPSSTIGIEFVGQSMILDNTTYRVQLWNTQGQENYHSIIDSYEIGASVLIVYDPDELDINTDNASSLNHIEHMQWNAGTFKYMHNRLERIRRADSTKQVFIIGRYIFEDSLSQRLRIGKLLAHDYGCHFIPLNRDCDPSAYSRVMQKILRTIVSDEKPEYNFTYTAPNGGDYQRETRSSPSQPFFQHNGRIPAEQHNRSIPDPIKEAYSILDLDTNASQKEIRQAYRRLALELHPDKNQGDTEAASKFIRVQDAFEKINSFLDNSHAGPSV